MDLPITQDLRRITSQEVDESFVQAIGQCRFLLTVALRCDGR
jgi:hypothetical protein